ncbi:hypothetical protein MP228_011398 [Amoeboaphelidium protococcarum]|nr:hypothetical protein MP228_011398 [Amoeboaphelidium protococcarum]
MRAKRFQLDLQGREADSSVVIWIVFCGGFVKWLDVKRGRLNGLLRCATHITKATQNQRRLKAAGLDDYALIDSQFMLFRSPLNPLLEHCSKMLSDFTGGKFNASQCKDVSLKVDLPWQQSASVDFLLNGPCGIVCLELDHEYHRFKMFGFPDPSYRHLSRYDPDVELCRMLAVSMQLFKATGKRSAWLRIGFGKSPDFTDLDASRLKIKTALDDLSTFLALGNNNTKIVKLEVSGECIEAFEKVD